MPRVVDSVSKRSEFVDASLDVIAREGLGAATLRRIAAEAGCTTGSVTHYFSGRDVLLVEALRSAHYAAAFRMTQAAAAAGSDAARLEAVVLESLPLDAVRLREWKVWQGFWSATSASGDLAAENARRYREWRDLLETLVAPFRRDPDEMRREASLLMAVVDGLGLRLALTKEIGDGLAVAQAQATADIGAYLSRLIAGGR
ncbi:TetR family transcriptional regulator C-terminal domain-containing protein [Phenylobacterium sp.]|uniref:TetR/AcrR family transcriptional regulator n=1 Tax=Phenylobacterium sp. TaxID=1871053 RepID=UPI0030F39408